jgi:hypothetical protein
MRKIDKSFRPFKMAPVMKLALQEYHIFKLMVENLLGSYILPNI